MLLQSISTGLDVMEFWPQINVIQERMILSYVTTFNYAWLKISEKFYSISKNIGLNMNWIGAL